MIVLSLASVACGRSEVVQGEVDHKTVSGVVENTGFTILQNVPGYHRDVVDDRPSIRMTDQDFLGFFTTNDEHAVISVEMESELRQKYSDITYLVHIRLPDGAEGTQSYFVSREVFNRILVDRPVRFKASGAPIPTINKLMEPGRIGFEKAPGRHHDKPSNTSMDCNGITRHFRRSSVRPDGR